MNKKEDPHILRILTHRREMWRRRRKRRIRVVLTGFILIMIVFLLVWRIAPDGNDDDGRAIYEPPDLSWPKNEVNEETAGYHVIIDPGHGGYDPGCGEEGYFEKDLNLVLANKVRDYLEGYGYSVMLTRIDDAALLPEERVEIVNGSNADIFISIHHNSLDNDSVTEGIETWYSEEANSLNETLAGYMQKEITKATDAKDRGTRISEKLIVLKGAVMPSCLIEVGFLSSHKERELLTKPDYQDKIAQGIAMGIQKFFN